MKTAAFAARSSRDAPPGEPRRATALHNMSIVPRSVVDLRPLRQGEGTGSRTPRGRHGRPGAFASGPSGELFARVHLVGLLCDGRAHEPCGRDIARGVGGGPPTDLLDAVALLRTRRTTRESLDAARRACQELTTAALHDEFLDRVAALGDMGLPPLLLARPVRPGARAACRPLAPLAALRLLAGTAGGVFVRARTPSAGLFLGGAPGVFVDATDFDYYLPLGTTSPGVASPGGAAPGIAAPGGAAHGERP
jgi:hypothetical protein